MYKAELEHPADFDGWRRAARRAFAAGVSPEEIVWTVRGELGDIFGRMPLPECEAPPLTVPKSFLDLAVLTALHSSPERFALLYGLFWRIASGETRLVDFRVDREVARAHAMAKAVRRDEHKMTAFVRFRLLAGVSPEQFCAWFEPEHHIVEAAAPFFVERFARLRWSILTPRRSVRWTGNKLIFSAGMDRRDAPAGDDLEELWRTYYAHIFNPARLNVRAMRAEMPKKYWRNLPEAALIKPLVEKAAGRTEAMIEEKPSEPAPRSHRIAARRSEAAEWSASPLAGLESLAASVRACERCALHAPATQAVAGEGPSDARIMIVGEKPGDREDLHGRPFVGPAGRVLDQVLARIGLDRRELYLTNAVKHFKFEPRGRRRIHRRPDAAEAAACRPWLMGEIDMVRPSFIAALGATAARALLGRPVRIEDLRGAFLSIGTGCSLIVTYHPSYLLRIEGEESRRRATADFTADLHLLAEAARAFPR